MLKATSPGAPSYTGAPGHLDWEVLRNWTWCQSCDSLYASLATGMGLAGLDKFLDGSKGKDGLGGKKQILHSVISKI